MSIVVEKAQVGANEISIETGRVARLAHGSVIIRCADSMVLVTVSGASEPRPGMGFFPLTVEYREGQYAAGKIPGGFFKREGRPTTREILTARVIDRPIRPLFPDGYMNDVQVYCQPLSADPACDTDVLAITGASAALCISNVPFAGPIAGVRVVRVDGEFIANPSDEERARAELDVTMAASRDAIVMVEGEANEVPEDVMIDALFFGHDAIQPLIDLQERLIAKVGKEKMHFEPPTFDEAIIKTMKKQFGKRMDAATRVKAKQERYLGLDSLKKEAKAWFLEELGEETFAEKARDISHAFNKVKKDTVRQRIIKKQERIDGRGLKDVRPIDIELGWLPRVHGSALFTRGETQASVTTTFGNRRDELKVETWHESHYKSFMLHYNFPAYSVGEVRPIRGPGRREIGHGMLAERSLAKVVPSSEEFPYTIRIVSDITESNGSSSMASVCGGSLAMMQAGVPLKAACAGVAMGLIQEGKDVAVLTDILGDEDHMGDMDFKVTGTRAGVCAIQMDIKIEGLTRDLLVAALEQAREGRLHILDCMDEAIQEPSNELSEFAPRIYTLHINPDRIRDLIGPGGKTIKGISEQTGVTVDVDDSGKVSITSPNAEASRRAIEIVESITQDVEPEKIYLGTVKAIKEFGAFVEVLPGQEGLLHISEIHAEHVENVKDILREGDEVLVKVMGIDGQGKIRLSRKAALAEKSAERQSQNGVHGEDNASEEVVISA